MPPENEALSVTPGSNLAFDYGGEVRPDHFDAGAFRLSYGSLSGITPPTDLRVEEDGRIPVPGGMRAGEYAVGVFVSGPQGEADYSFLIDVDMKRNAGP